MSARQQEDSNMIVPAIFITVAMAAALYLLVFPIPAVRCAIYLLLIVVKLFGALLVMDFDAVGKLLDLAGIILDGLKAGMRPNPGAIYRAILEAGPPPLLVGLVVSAIAAAPAAFILPKRRFPSERKAVKRQAGKNLKQVLRDWRIEGELSGNEPPEELAAKFAKIREKKNIPPNVIARKIADPVRRSALWHFNRATKHGEIFRKITNTEELRNIGRNREAPES